jgi:hypothetical protein
MNLMDAAALDFACDVCGGRRYITLRQMASSQELLAGEGCTSPEGERECPAVYYGGLVDQHLIAQLEDAWNRLDERARALGARLTVSAASAETRRPRPASPA